MEEESQSGEPKYWHKSQEEILKSWGELCSCYRYLHFQAFLSYKRQCLRFTIPIIIISTITGTANFAQETFPVAVREYVPAMIGTLNLIAAIMTTLSQFLKVNELQESHRVSSIHYGKLCRSIRLELSLPISERKHNGANMVDLGRAEYDRLIEQSPAIPSCILKDFEKNVEEGITTPEILRVRGITIYDNSNELEQIEKVVEKFKIKKDEK